MEAGAPAADVSSCCTPLQWHFGQLWFLSHEMFRQMSLAKLVLEGNVPDKVFAFNCSFHHGGHENPRFR